MDSKQSETVAVASDGLLGVWECFSDPCYYDMWAVRRTHERGWGECFHMNSAEEAKALTALLNHAAKLHALSSPNKRPSDTSESSCL